MALFWNHNCPDIIIDCLCFVHDHRRSRPPGNTPFSHACPKRDCHHNPNGNANNRILFHQYACPNGYRAPDNTYSDGYRHHRASAEPDAPAKRYALGHLDAEHNAHKYQNPHAHPDSFGHLHPRPNPDAEPERYPLAGPYPNQINYA
jgi:hypothetical protein